MKILVEYYSRLRDLTQIDEEAWDLEPGATVGDLVQRCYLRHAGLGAWHAHLLLAVGVDYVNRAHPLRDGDTVSIMPPVQGG